MPCPTTSVCPKKSEELLCWMNNTVHGSPTNHNRIYFCIRIAPQLFSTSYARTSESPLRRANHHSLNAGFPRIPFSLLGSLPHLRARAAGALISNSFSSSTFAEHLPNEPQLSNRTSRRVDKRRLHHDRLLGNTLAAQESLKALLAYVPKAYVRMPVKLGT